MFINVTTFNRSNIAIPSLQQLIKATNEGSKHPIVITDDGSTDNTLNCYLLALTKKHASRYICVNLLTHAGVEQNNIKRLLFTPAYFLINYEFVYFTDDDMQYSSQFLQQLNQVKEYMLHNNNIFAATLFNVNHLRSPTHTPVGEIDGYDIKPSFGGCSMLIRTVDFSNAMQHYTSRQYNGNQGWDWAICHYAQQQNKLLIATKNSYVQHIGKTGVNSNPNAYDFATNFID